MNVLAVSDLPASDTQDHMAEVHPAHPEQKADRSVSGARKDVLSARYLRSYRAAD
jgi:hypothetical protein